MPRPSNTAERRREIVNGLIRVMAGSGYDGASIAAVAEEAGVLPGSVHYHFDNKLEILLGAIDEIEQRLDRRYRARSESAKSAWERLCAYLDAHVALGRDADPDAVACWVMIGAEAVREPTVRVAYERVVTSTLATLETLVREILASERRDPRAARSIAAALLSAIEGAYRLAIVARATPSGFAAPMLRQIAEAVIFRAKTREKTV